VPSFWIALTISFAVYESGKQCERYQFQLFNKANGCHSGSEQPQSSQPLPSNSNLDIRMCPINLSGTIVGNNGPMAAISYIKGQTDGVQKLYGNPMLFPCHLRQRRPAPFKDSFRHSYLYIGTPVGSRLLQSDYVY
jgi:hypothetical protein